MVNFMFLKTSKIKPFVGLGLGYRRATLEYSESDPFFNQALGFGFGQSLEQAEYVGNYVTGEATIGADVRITPLIGARVAVNYIKGLTDSSRNATSADQNNVFFQSPDQNNLDNIGREIEDSTMLGVSAGLVINF